MTQAEKNRYEDVEALKGIIQKLNGKKFTLKVGIMSRRGIICNLVIIRNGKELVIIVRCVGIDEVILKLGKLLSA